MDNTVDRVTDFNVGEGDTLELTSLLSEVGISDLFDDMESGELTSLLATLESTDGDVAIGVEGLSIAVSGDGDDATLTITSSGETLSIDFDGASAADIASSLLDNFYDIIPE
jgi:hypothetical protein